MENFLTSGKQSITPFQMQRQSRYAKCSFNKLLLFFSFTAHLNTWTLHKRRQRNKSGTLLISKIRKIAVHSFGMVIVIWCAIIVIVLNSMVRYIQWALTSIFILHIIFYPLLCVCHYCAHPSIKSLWHLFGSYVQFRLEHNTILCD